MKRKQANYHEKYDSFYKSFGMQLKFGVYNNYGMDKDKVSDLLLSTQNKVYASCAEKMELLRKQKKFII